MGGYRLVRRLGAGARAEVFLGHAMEQTAPVTPVAAIKVYRSSVAAASTDDEITVLARTHSPHLLRLIDVATAPDGNPCLVLPRLNGSLARLLAERDSVGAGEAVTILAPLCEAVSALHQARSCHGTIRPGVVLFDDRGAPVLACFGGASVFDAGNARVDRAVTPAELAAEPGVGDDLQRLGALAGVVLSRAVSGDHPDRIAHVLAWLREVEPADEPHTFAQQLRERLFALAPAEPVDLGGVVAPAARAVEAPPATRGTRLTVGSGAPRTATDAPAETHPSMRSRGVAAIARRRIAALSLRVPALVRPIIRAWAAVASTRKAFRIVAVAGVLAVVLAILLVPSTAQSDSPPDRARKAVGSESGRTPSPMPTRAATTASPTASPSSAPSGVGTDDPVVALEQLLRARDRCIRRLSVTCLDAVDQPGSSALDGDSHLIRSLQQGAATANSEPLGGSEAALTQRLGDSALLTLNRPGTAALSILLVKQQSGWRIRDFLPA